MHDSASVRPVFVDPSGRRRRVLRVATIAAAATTVGYLSLVLLAALGSPLPPLARLAVPPGLNLDGTSNGGLAPRADAVPPAPAANADNAGVSARNTSPTPPAPLQARPGQAPAPAAVTPAAPAVPQPVATPTTTTAAVERGSGPPSDPPGQGQPPTALPSQGQPPTAPPGRG